MTIRGSITLALLLSSLSGASWSVATDAPRAAPTRDKAVPDCAQFASARKNVAYPRDELRRGVRGWVALSYKLAGDGTATDIRVVDSEPKDVFVQAAASALQQWRFSEGVVQDACLHIVKFETAGGGG